MHTAVSDLDWLVIGHTHKPERLARFQRDAARFGLPIETVEATDGSETNISELAQLDLVEPNRMSGWDADGIGNALSHWMCWHQVIESGRPACIFEATALMRTDFVDGVLQLVDALPEGWDMAQLGCNTDSVLEIAVTPDCYFRAAFSVRHETEAECAAFAKSTGAVVPLRLRVSFGSFAYLVSPAGAQKLVDGCFPLAARTYFVAGLGDKMLRATTIDGMMNTVYSRIEAYASFPPLAIRRRDHMAEDRAESPAA